MCRNIYLTEKEKEILFHVESNGGFGVTTCPKVVKQNKNFYNRVRKLEEKGLIDVQRYDGQASDLTLTPYGKEYLNEIGTMGSLIEKQSDEQFLISLVKSSSLSKKLKDKVIAVLS